MATYNKRGYRTPKEKEETGGEYIEDANVDTADSTTAEVFSKLDEGASKTEDFVAKNQKYILGFLALAALITVGYLLFQKFVAEPKQNDAADDIFVAQQNFQKAIDGDAKSDSLFKLSLNGSEGKQGFIQIADQYSGTDAGNLANYYAGVAYLNTKKYAEAIASLEKFNANDAVLAASTLGLLGDAYAEQKQMDKALDYYVKASNKNKNDYTTPRFLMKAGQTALALKKNEDALKYFTEIKEKYESSDEARNVDAMIGLAQ